MDVQWVSSGGGAGGGSTAERFLISSVSADGKLLFWSLKNMLSHPIKGYLLTPQGASKSKGPYPVAHGGVCLSTMEQGSGSATRAKWLLVGLEGGHILRSQVAKLLPSGSSNNTAFLTSESFKNATYAEDVYSSINKGSGGDRGGVFYYESHIGNVNSIDTSPFHRSLFMSVGNDGDIHLYNLLEKKPLRCFEAMSAKSKVAAVGHMGGGNNLNCSFSNVSCVKFSPLKPTIFATASTTGFVSVYDLTSPTASPLYQFDVQADFSQHRKGEDGNSVAAFTPGAGITNVAFNAARKNLLAACDTSGNIHIYRLNSFLSNPNLQNANQMQSDIEYLNQLGNRNS
jgi:WD40 repeat protein